MSKGDLGSPAEGSGPWERLGCACRCEEEHKVEPLALLYVLCLRANWFVFSSNIDCVFCRCSILLSKTIVECTLQVIAHDRFEYNFPELMACTNKSVLKKHTLCCTQTQTLNIREEKAIS